MTQYLTVFIYTSGSTVTAVFLRGRTECPVVTKFGTRVTAKHRISNQAITGTAVCPKCLKVKYVVVYGILYVGQSDSN